MKKIGLLFCLSLLGVAHAQGDVIPLNNEKMDLGVLYQISGQAASETFVFQRTSATPEEIDLSFRYNYAVNTCVEWRYERVWVPGRWEKRCWVENGHRRCKNVWVPGYYQTVRVCARYEDMWHEDSERLEFDFEDAATLGQREEELFKVTVYQTGRYSTNLKAKGEVVKASSAYKIKQKGGLFSKEGLKFKALKD